MLYDTTRNLLGGGCGPAYGLPDQFGLTGWLHKFSELHSLRQWYSPALGDHQHGRLPGDDAAHLDSAVCFVRGRLECGVWRLIVHLVPARH